MIDAHIHLQDKAFDPDRAQITAQAQAAGINAFFCAATRPSDWENVIGLSKTNSRIIPFIGTHPWYAHEHQPDLLRETLKKHPGTGVGEIGLDSLHGTDSQTDVFKDQLEAAYDFSRSCSVHCVKSFDTLFPLLKQAKKLPPALLFHAFGGTVRDAEFLLGYNAYFSFGGTALNPARTRTHEVIKNLPLERILTETDAPDMLPPREFRTDYAEKRNLPANLPLIIEGLAAIRGIPAQMLAETAEENARRFKGYMP